MSCLSYSLIPKICKSSYINFCLLSRPENLVSYLNYDFQDHNFNFSPSACVMDLYNPLIPRVTKTEFLITNLVLVLVLVLVL